MSLLRKQTDVSLLLIFSAQPEKCRKNQRISLLTHHIQRGAYKDGPEI